MQILFKKNIPENVAADQKVEPKKNISKLLSSLASKKEALLKKKEEEEKKPEDKETSKPLISNVPTLLLDSEGREIDSEGNLVGNTMERISSVKANQKFITSTKFTDLLKEEISASRAPASSSTEKQKDSTKKNSKFF